MRKQSLMIIIMLLLVFAAGYFLLSDALIEHQIESTMTDVIGTKVELDGFKLSVLSASVSWRRLQIADPENGMHNIVETGNATCDIAVEPILYGRWIIEEMRLEELQSGTEREFDGTIETKLGGNEESNTSKAGENIFKKLTGGFDLANVSKQVDVDAIVAKLDLQTPQKSTELKGRIEGISFELENQKQQFKQIENRSSAFIKKAEGINPKTLSGVNDYISFVKTMNEMRQEAVVIRDDFNSGKNEAADYFKKIASDAAEIDDWIASDIAAAQSLAKLPDPNNLEIGTMLFGDKVGGYIDQGLRYLPQLRKIAGSLKDDETVENNYRSTGQTVNFPDSRGWPEFQIKKMVISGSLKNAENAITLSGNVENITSNQRVSGRPTTVEIKGNSFDGRGYTLTANVDHIQTPGVEQFTLGIEGNKLSGILSNDELKFTSGSYSTRVQFINSDDKLSGSVEITAVYPMIDISGDGLKENLFRRLFKSINGFGVKTEFTQSSDGFTTKISSTLDESASQFVRTELGDQLSKSRKIVEQKVNSLLAPEKQKLTAMAKSILLDYKQYESLIETKTANNFAVLEGYKTVIFSRIDTERNPLLKRALQKVKGMIKW